MVLTLLQRHVEGVLRDVEAQLVQVLRLADNHLELGGKCHAVRRRGQHEGLRLVTLGLVIALLIPATHSDTLIPRRDGLEYRLTKFLQRDRGHRDLPVVVQL